MTSRSRKRDVIWDAVAEVFFPSGVAKSESARVGKVVAALKEKNATPEQIEERMQQIPKEWGPPTPEALVKHWDMLRPPETEVQRRWREASA